MRTLLLIAAAALGYELWARGTVEGRLCTRLVAAEISHYKNFDVH